MPPIPLLFWHGKIFVMHIYITKVISEASSIPWSFSLLVAVMSGQVEKCLKITESIMRPIFQWWAPVRPANISPKGSGGWRPGREITKGTQNCIRFYNWQYLIAIQHMREFVKYLAECFNHTKPKLYANHKLV